MCIKTMKELKMRRGYADVIYLMRTSNVRMDSMGYELLQVAIMSYLHNPNLPMRELVKIALKNAPMPLANEEACLDEMKQALQSIYTVHYKKLDEDSLVFNFIRSVASEVRMGTLIEIRVVSEDLTQLDKNTKAAFCAVAIRRMEKPNDTFLEVLNHCAGRYGYDDVSDLLIDLYKVVKNNSYETKLKNCSDSKERFEKRENIGIAIQPEVEDLVSVIISEHENMIF